MGMNPKRTTGSKRRPAQVLAWTAAGIALSVATIRLFVGASAGRDLGAFAIVVAVLLALFFITLVTILVLLSLRRSRRRGLMSLRERYPDAVVLPVSVGKDQSQVLRDIGRVSRGFHPPQEAKAVVSKEGFALWNSRGSSLIAVALDPPVRYQPGNYTTLAGTFRTLNVDFLKGGERVELTLFPLDENSGFIPRQLDSAALDQVVRQLNE